MNLVIDIGNTLQKVGVFSEEGELIFYQAYTTIALDELQRLIEQHHIHHTILSSVVKEETKIEQLLKQTTHYIPFNQHTALPITILYDYPETLGLDRRANAVAACSRFPQENVLSIQAGSCLVYDFIDDKGNYRGGAISPGINMRFKALHTFTGKLPQLNVREIDFTIGNTTQQSIESGVINGAIYEINGFIEQYRKEIPDMKVLIAGGDSGYLHKSIKSAIFVGSNFILYGLHEILKFNVEKM